MFRRLAKFGREYLSKTNIVLFCIYIFVVSIVVYQAKQVLDQSMPHLSNMTRSLIIDLVNTSRHFDLFKDLLEAYDNKPPKVEVKKFADGLSHRSHYLSAQVAKYPFTKDELHIYREEFDYQASVVAELANELLAQAPNLAKVEKHIIDYEASLAYVTTSVNQAVADHAEQHRLVLSRLTNILVIFGSAILLLFGLLLWALRVLIHQKSRLKSWAYQDGMTQLYNRRFFNETFPQQFEGTKRSGALLGLLIIDIDYFKAYNDRHGHSEGDEVLIRVASIITACLQRKSDVAYRIGGEEFACLMHPQKETELMETADKIRIAIYNANISHRDNSSTGRVTVSIGLCNIPNKRVIRSRDMFNCADMALYQAKDKGRNTCVLAEEI